MSEMVNVDMEINLVATVIGFGEGPEAAGNGDDAVKCEEFDC